MTEAKMATGINRGSHPARRKSDTFDSVSWHYADRSYLMMCAVSAMCWFTSLFCALSQPTPFLLLFVDD